MLGDIVLESFELVWCMYDEAIERIPEENWKTGDIDYLTPSRLINHVIMAGDFYTGELDGFNWEARYGSSPMSLPQDRLPTREQTLEYHVSVKGKIADWLRSLDDESMLGAEDVFTWTGATKMSRALYLLSHYRQHLGEINAELRRHGLDRVKWKTYESSG